MSSDTQTILALLVVAAAAAALVRSALKARKKPGCGSACCPTDTFKQKLKR